MNRETVITHLQIIHTWAEFARERDLNFFTAKHLENIAKWSDDALALLKEDCHNCKLECLLQKYDELKGKYDALLKEQGNCENCAIAIEDRQPIVRCKDCKNNNQCSIQFKFADADNPDNWFCAYGKRKEGR